MHFNIYLDDATGDRLAGAAQKAGVTRNALIRQAVGVWLARDVQPVWPTAVLAHEGDAMAEPFESHRQALLPPVSDPLA